MDLVMEGGLVLVPHPLLPAPLHRPPHPIGILEVAERHREPVRVQELPLRPDVEHPLLLGDDGTGHDDPVWRDLAELVQHPRLDSRGRLDAVALVQGDELGLPPVQRLEDRESAAPTLGSSDVTPFVLLDDSPRCGERIVVDDDEVKDILAIVSRQRYTPLACLLVPHNDTSGEGAVCRDLLLPDTDDREGAEDQNPASLAHRVEARGIVDQGLGLPRARGHKQCPPEARRQ